MVGRTTLVMSSALDVPLSDAASRSGVLVAAGAVVSRVTFRAAEAPEMLPATSVWVAVMLLAPSANAVVAATDQPPPAATAPVPMVVAPSRSVTVAPASPVPVMVGRATLVMSSPCAPLSLAGLRASAVGAAAVVSRVTPSAAEGPEVLPATSVWVAVMVLAPSVSALVAVIDQPPSAATVPVPMVAAPSSSVTVAPASPVPVMVGRTTSVMSSVLELPLSLAVVRASAVGAAAVVSRVTSSAAEAPEVLPAASVWVAVMVLAPSVSAVVAVIDQPPSAATVPVPMVVAPSSSVTVAPTLAGAGDGGQDDDW